MATTVSYSASMRTRKTNSSSNAKSSAASQEYYENTYNYVGIVHFAGMALSGKVITGISLRIVAAQAGYGTGHTKTVYVRKSNYQSASQSGITGLGYCGDALGTFTGTFYGNTSTYTLSGDLLNNLAAYIAEGSNTICLYDTHSAGQRRHGREQRKGGAVQPRHLLFRVAPQQRYGRANLPCAGLMR